MTFTICAPSGRVVVQYIVNNNEPTFEILDHILRNDVAEGLKVPYHLQREFGERSILPYPPDKEDIKIFAMAYKRIIYASELIKHGFYIQENHEDNPVFHKV